MNARPADTAGPPETAQPARPAAAAASVVIEGLTYTYPAWSDRPDPALIDVCLALHPGLTVVDGDSGSGKSTLLRVLNGLVPHFHGGVLRGRAVVCGLDVATTPTRRLARSVGFVFQEPEAGFVRGTVAREVAFFPENLGFPPATVRRRVGAALEQVGIAPLASRRLRTLSGGERQRVALAAALAGSPSIVAMDEPMSQLDRRGAAALMLTLTSLAEAGATVAVAEHRLAGVPLASARRLTLVAGRVGEAPARQVPPLRATRAAGDAAAASASASASARAEAWSLAGVTAGVERRAVIDGIDLAGARGEAVVVTGPNGSGKTTLLRTIAGLAPPLAGKVDRRPGRIAYLPQEPGLLLHRQSVRTEVDQTLRWSKGDGTADEVLDLLGLRGLAERDPRDLSGGQRQRAALAVVLAGRPALALLDEPTRGMDAAARLSLAGALGRLAGEGAAVVVATHDLELARELSARVLRIEDGVVVADDPTRR
ncbi:MAG: ATP-binding cassette domain-containing protein [Actinomycetota bacterium]|nr:ATP-binding cassette domain-containing protein [Actinomycetota bacterium]